MGYVFMGTVRSSKSCKTWVKAHKTLGELRAIYPEKNGYTEIKSGIRELSDGSFRAWRKHMHVQ